MRVGTVHNSSRSALLEIRHEQSFNPAPGRHRHDFHQIAVCLSGDADLSWWNEGVGTQKVRARHRNIVINPANAFHSTDWTGSLDRLMLNLHCDVTKRVATELDMSDDFRICPTASGRDDAVWHLAFMLFQELGSDPLKSTLYAESIANLLAVRLLKRFTKSAESASTLPAAPFTVRQMAVIDEYISSNLEAEITVSTLAALLNLGQVQFSRRLKAGTGMSPYQYVTNRRISRSCELLDANRQSIADIGLEVGFDGQSHFSARFKQIVGMTPREYRNMKKGKLLACGPDEG